MDVKAVNDVLFKSANRTVGRVLKLLEKEGVDVNVFRKRLADIIHGQRRTSIDQINGLIQEENTDGRTDGHGIE